MLWVGLTGGLASGKTTVAKKLLEWSYPVIDADRLAKENSEPGSQGFAEIIQHFGPGVLDVHGHLDRKKIAALVFSSPEDLRILEGILHPLVQVEVQSQRRWLEDQGCHVAFYDVPLLFEKKLESQFDRTLLIAATTELQVERMKLHRGWTDQEITSRLKSQWSMEEKRKRATDVIENNGSLEDLFFKLKTYLDTKIQN